MDAAIMRMAQYYVDASVDMREALCLPRVSDIPLFFLGQGEHNVNFMFRHPGTGQRLVLRINFESQLGLSQQIEYEYAALGELASSTRVPKGLFLDGSKSLIDHGVMVMEYREGKPLDFKRPGDVEEAARILADIHAVVPSKDSKILRPASALCDLFDECVQMFSVYRSSALASKGILNQVECFFESVAALVHIPAHRQDADHILNTEAVPSHFLIPHDGSAGSMIDWEKPILGDVARDVAYFLAPTTTIWDSDFQFDEKGRRAFVESYWCAVGGRFSRGSFDEQFDAFMKMNCLRGITWSAMTSVYYADPAHPLKNQKTRGKLQIYLSPAYLSMLARDYFHCPVCVAF